MGVGSSLGGSRLLALRVVLLWRARAVALLLALASAPRAWLCSGSSSRQLSSASVCSFSSLGLVELVPPACVAAPGRLKHRVIRRADPCPADLDGRECSGHGLCRRGRCLCDPGYSGSACEPKREAPSAARAGRNRMLDDNGRPRYGRAYADQLKQDLADEMDRRRAENEQRMRRLRDQFKDQNKQIEEASSGAPPPGAARVGGSVPERESPGPRYVALISMLAVFVGDCRRERKAGACTRGEPGADRRDAGAARG